MELTCLVYKEINFDPAIKQVLGNDWTDHHIGLHLPQDQQDLQDLLHTVQEVLRVGDTPGTGESLKYLYMMFSNFFLSMQVNYTSPGYQVRFPHPSYFSLRI